MVRLRSFVRWGTMAAKRKSKDGEPGRVDGAGPGPESVAGKVAEALRASAANAADEAPWERLEDEAAQGQWSPALLDQYRARLSGEISEAALGVLSRRAVAFAADCFGENAPQMVEILRAVLAASPQADWAFRHLVMALSTTERWGELLDAYDAQLASGKNAARRKELLGDAAHIAKDLARDAARATLYLDQLLRLAPSDEQAAAALERLLERQERWDDLARVWRQRVERLSPGPARALRQRIAILLFEKMGHAQAALDEARGLAQEGADDPSVLALLERLLGGAEVPAEVRLGALDLLRPRSDAAKVPALLQIAIAFAEGKTLSALRRECGERLHELGDLAGAVDQYVALAALLPEELEVEDRLRQLAEAARAPEKLAAGLAAAANACTGDERRVALVMRAAWVQDRELGHHAEAAALLERAVAERAVSPEQKREALARLEQLRAELHDEPRRLDALERLAAAEPRPGEQRLVWARAAALAARLGDVDRAVAAWERRLALDPRDPEALAARIEVLESARRWPALVLALRQRIAAEPPPHQARADLVRIATVARDEQQDLAVAIDTWREVTTRFGEDLESVTALAELYTVTARHADLADILARNAVADRGRQAANLARLGDALRERLGEASAAIDWYRRSLDADPALERARSGLAALLGDPALAPAAAEVLAHAAEKTASWALMLDVLPHRLVHATPERKVALLVQAAGHGDPARAFEWLCQALPLAPAAPELEAEVLRLAAQTGGYDRAVQALGEAIAAGQVPSHVIAHLEEQRAALAEARLGDAASARQGYAAAVAIVPGRLEARLGLVRTAAALGRWAEAAAAVVDALVSPDTRESTLLPLYQSRAAELGASREAAEALGAATVEARGLAPALKRDLHAAVALQLADLDAADAQFGHALALDPDHLPTLLRRAERQRTRPDRRLLETLLRLATLVPTDLDPAREAAELALTLGDEGLALDTLGRLWNGAVHLLRQRVAAAGRHQPADAAAFALEETVRRHEASGVPERIGRATGQLLDGARLPVDDERRRQWLRRAAEMTASALGDRPEAIRIWRLLHEEAPADGRARESLARLYEDEERFAEALELRRRELDATAEPDRRLALRLDIVRLDALLSHQCDAATVLLANLAERPGHPPTVARLTETLMQRRRPGDLADVLDAQARVLEERGETGPSATLWAQLARLAEASLSDRARAIAAWQQVARLDPTAEALDALGRLELEAGAPSAAAAWLDRRLGLTEGPARCEVTARLARAYLAAGQRHRAIAALDRTLGEFPRAEDLRTPLAELYQAAQSWELQARVLAEGCEYTEDTAELTARARQVVELYGRVNLLGQAVPVLERVVRLVPDDEGFRSALADGLTAVGRHDDARALLGQLIQQSGWRRSRKRATLHSRLAAVARAQGDLPFALAQLEEAATMDVANMEILHHLAEVAEAAGQPERAERAYRALLVLRRKEGAPAEALTVAEILLRLHDLAGKRGASGEASELVESALTAAIGDAEQSRRLQHLLLERGAHDLLSRLFEKRLAHTAGSPEQADVYAEVATSLEAQGRRDEAFDAEVAALEMDPERPGLHEGAVRLARAEGKVERLVERLLGAAGRRRRRPESHLATTLTLRAATLVETDLGDLDRARELFQRAAETEPTSIEVLSGLARLAARRDDHAECLRIVSVLKTSAAEAATPAAAAEALFCVAALEMADPQTREAGIASLCEALEKSRDVERARQLVTAAGLPAQDLVKILPLYERVARQSGDERMLLDYLERQASTPEATAAEVREAVDLAVALNKPDRIEPLLTRLADLAAARPEGAAEAGWAMLELVQRKKSAGDFPGAARALERAAEHLDPERVLSLARDLGERAARAGQVRLGAELLERLRARAPGDETVWRPLLAHYIQLGDRPGVDRLVEETLPLLASVEPRNELRLARARFLLGRDDRDAGAAEALRDAVFEAPGHAEALQLLADYYQRTGAHGELVDLLEQRFEAVLASGDQDRIVELGLRLGEALDRTDRDRASEVYERASAAAPGRRELLRRILSRVPTGEITAERADMMEELLVGGGSAEEQAALARELAAARTRLGDDEGARRALVKGRELSPADPGLSSELEGWYRSHEAWGPLAALLAEEAGQVGEDDPDEAAALLSEAATLREDRLGETAAALQLLRQARDRAPRSGDVLEHLARTLVRSGDRAGAHAEVQEALAGASPEDRVALLHLRAELEQASDDHRAAVATLAEAHELAPERAEEPLSAALDRWQAQAAAAADGSALREATLALARFASKRGDLAQARRLIDGLLAEGSVDPETLRLGGILAETAGDLERATELARQLLALETGDGKVIAAERLAALAERIGRPADAVAALEAMLAAAPGDRRLTDRLVLLYEKAGERRKLGLLLYDQANRSEDETRRFELLARAGSLLVEARDGSAAMMVLNEAAAMRANEPEVTLLLSDAYALAGALDEAADLIKPLVAAHKGKPSPAASALYVRMARLAALAADTGAEIDALTRALEADKKNGALAAQLADRAEAAGDDETAMKALRTITLHDAPGPMSSALAFLRQARIAHRRGDKDRAILFARRAAQEAEDHDPVLAESRDFLKSVGAARPD
jgi:tetratricopeptide (TPR) repeat protein